jgi:hypothetical protein
VGNVTTLTGPCTDENGLDWAGTLVLENIPSMHGEADGYRHGQPGKMTFDHYVFRDDDEDLMRIDGAIDVTFDSFLPKAVSGDLHVFDRGTTYEVQPQLACDLDQHCTIDGTTFEIDGLGAGSSDGAWGIQQGFWGSVTLHGDVDVVYDVGAWSFGGCLPSTVDGAERPLCPSR